MITKDLGKKLMAYLVSIFWDPKKTHARLLRGAALFFFSFAQRDEKEKMS